MGSTIHVCALKQESQPKECEALMTFLSAHQHLLIVWDLVNYCSSLSWPCLIIVHFNFSCPQLIAAYLISSLQSCFLYDPHKTFYHISITEHFPKVQECYIIFFFFLFFQKYWLQGPVPKPSTDFSSFRYMNSLLLTTKSRVLSFPSPSCIRRC